MELCHMCSVIHFPISFHTVYLAEHKARVIQLKSFSEALSTSYLLWQARREKISERMKILQDLVPGCNKVSHDFQTL